MDEKNYFGIDRFPARQLKVFHLKKKNTLRRVADSNYIRKWEFERREGDVEYYSGKFNVKNINFNLQQRYAKTAQILKDLRNFFEKTWATSRRTKRHQRTLASKGLHYRSKMLGLFEKECAEVKFPFDYLDFWQEEWKPTSRYLVKVFVENRLHGYRRYPDIRFFETDAINFILPHCNLFQKRKSNSPIQILEVDTIDLPAFKSIVSQVFPQYTQFFDGGYKFPDVELFINCFTNYRTKDLDDNTSRSRFICSSNYKICARYMKYSPRRNGRKSSEKRNLHLLLKGY